MPPINYRSFGLLSLSSLVCILIFGFLICNDEYFLAEAAPIDQSVFESIGSDPDSTDIDKPPYNLLLSDPVFQDENERSGPKWDNVVMLSRSLRKIGELDAYFTHRGRPRDMRLPNRSWGVLMKSPTFESGSGMAGQSPGATASAKYDDIAQLTETLDKLGDLGKYFSHRGRPRYG